MSAEVIALDAASPDRAQISRAASALADGALVAFPTETVYGLAASAASRAGVERLRDIKSRAGKSGAAPQPFTVHIGEKADHARFVAGMSPLGKRLIQKGWPGPLTLVVPVDDPTHTDVYRELCPEGAASVFSEHTVGIRCPDDVVASRLISEARCPVIASSANRAGEAPPMSAQDIGESMLGDVDFILDAGPTRYGKASTIVSVNGSSYEVLRVGVWDERTIRKLATLTILFVCTGNTCRSPMAEALAKQEIAKRLGCHIDELEARGIFVRSAGTGAFGGGAAREAIEACRRRGVDISGHRSRPLDEELMRQADYVFTMAKHHYEYAVGMAHGAASRIMPLDPEGDIADPLGGPLAQYEAAADRIAQCLAMRLNEVQL